MPMESDIDVLLSCYLADSDRSPQTRRERKPVYPAAVVVEVAEGAADTPTQLTAARDAVGGDDYIITCNFHDDVVTPAGGAHQPSQSDTADVRRINHQDPERFSSGGRKRPRNITALTSRSNPLNGSSSCMDYCAGQDIRPSRSSHGNRDMVPSISTRYGQDSYRDEVSSFETRLVETQPAQAPVTGRQMYKKQKVILDHDVHKSTYEYISAKDVSDGNAVCYQSQDTLSWYVHEKGGLQSHSGFEHPLHSLSRCCEKMVPCRSSALKSLVDGMAAEVTGHTEMYLEHQGHRRFGSRSEADEEAGNVRPEQTTSAWHQPLDATHLSGAVDSLKVKASHIFRSVPEGTVTECQQQEGPNGDENSYGYEKRVELVCGENDSAELSRGRYYVDDSCGALRLEEEDEPVQDSVPSDQAQTGPEKQDRGHNANQIRRILTRRRYILDTDSPSPTRSGFHPQTQKKAGYSSSHRTNPPFFQHATESANPTSLQTRKAKLWHPNTEDHGAINSLHLSGKDTQLPDKRVSSLQDDSIRCDSVNQSYELQSFGFFSEAKEATTVTDSAPGSSLSDFRALVEAFDSEESVSEEMVIDPVYGTCQDTFTSATKSELSLHKSRSTSQQLTYTCSLCGRDNLSRKTIRRHEARNYTCSKCNKKFCLQDLLLKHKKSKLCSQGGGTQMTDIACV